jgi:hypothetical protein
MNVEERYRCQCICDWQLVKYLWLTTEKLGFWLRDFARAIARALQCLVQEEYA